MGDSEIIYRVRKIYRRNGTLLDNGAVVCRGGRIVEVNPWHELKTCADAKTVDLGDSLLLPGLINAHTHLRLTHLKGKIAPTDDFVGWLGRIALSNKFTRTSTLESSIKEGVKELLKNGVTTAVEIDMDGLSTGTVGNTPLRLIFAHECIGLNPSKAEEKASDLFSRVAQYSEEPYRRQHGIAPHSPYSVCRELQEAIARRLWERRSFLTVHIAESSEEVEMLAEAKGALFRSLRLFGVLPSDWQPPGCGPVEFLKQTNLLTTPGIAVHCGQTTESDTQRLVHNGWTVAFCPGTHEYFGRSPWPLERFQWLGVPVCIATDSAASNTSGLSLMEEMRRMARMFPQLEAKHIVAAATTVPAHAIGWGDVVGQIAPGFFADFSCWSFKANAESLDRQWFEGDSPLCTATIIDGKSV